jgi:predicted nucleotidyltransferase component of viral defense system
MIPSREIREKARACGVPETTVERDYAQNWLLKYLPTKNMILKGGTGIRKLYIANYRFSDDLDFSLLEDLEKNDLEDEISNAVKGAKEESGINFDVSLKINENENGYVVLIHFRVMRNVGNPLKIKLDITNAKKEIIKLPVEKRPIIHPYSDDYKAEILAYSLEEIVAEKTRALFERTRPRDLYDVWYLWNRINKEKAVELLEEKCRFKGVSIDTSSLIARKSDFNNAWENSLRHQLKQLPDFDKTFDEVLGGIIKGLEEGNDSK